MRLPPSVAQPRPITVTCSEVRPINRFSKAGIVLPLYLCFAMAAVRVVPIQKQNDPRTHASVVFPRRLASRLAEP